MSHARSYKSCAIVLRGRQLGEADRIFTLLTEERGKIDAIAKGIRRPKSHLGGRLEFMSESQLALHRGRNLDVIVSAEIVRSPWPAIVEPAAFAAAHLLSELIDAFCEHDLAVPDVYELLRGAIGALGKFAEPAAILPRFELRLLHALGLAPAAETCVRCGGLFAGGAWTDLAGGGLACESCRNGRGGVVELATRDVANFQSLGAERGGAVRAAALATPACARAVETFVMYHLGKQPKSLGGFGALAH